MWIVRLALRRPYTFVVMALLIGILGGLSIATMPVDIFPYIDLPVVSVVWQYNGLTPEEMESRIVTNFERALTANVVGCEHVETQSHQSVAVVRARPSGRAVAGAVQKWRSAKSKSLLPPSICRRSSAYDAACRFSARVEQPDAHRAGIFDLGNNFIPRRLRRRAGCGGVAIRSGKNSDHGDLNPEGLHAKRLRRLTCRTP
jgi:multidrug efflux pump subunit AcrB